MRSDVSVVGVQYMGGGGKTTSVLALCNDPEIKELFANNVVFITVSQCPNLKAILETMWDKVSGRSLQLSGASVSSSLSITGLSSSNDCGTPMLTTRNGERIICGMSRGMSLLRLGFPGIGSSGISGMVLIRWFLRHIKLFLVNSNIIRSSSSSRGSVSSSNSDGEPGIGSVELEAVADSFTSKQSRLTSLKQIELDWPGEMVKHHQIPNDITKKTPASFEPSIDYVVTEIPCLPFEKFTASSYNSDEVVREGIAEAEGQEVGQV